MSKKVLSITLNYDQNLLIDSNESITPFNLKIITHKCPIQSIPVTATIPDQLFQTNILKIKCIY